MKQNTLSLLVALSGLVPFLRTPVYGQTAEKLPFAFRVDNGAITITKYISPRKVEARDGMAPLLADLAEERVAVPTELNGLPVVEIGANAFANCPGLTTVRIPSGIRLIRDNAFRGCAGLQTLQIPASVTSLNATAFADCRRLVAIRVDEANPAYWSDADGVVFSKDKKTLVRYPSGRSGSVKVPNSVVAVGDCAFVGCRELTAIDLPAGLTAIGPWVFADCSALRSVAFPDTLATIGEFAFWGCGGLTGVTIPGSVTNIGYFTFAHCHGLNSATIPRNVTAMGPNIFRDCGRLTNIVVDAANPVFCSVGGVVFDKQKTRLISFPCGKAGCYEVPGGVTGIDQSAFRRAGNVTCVHLPDSVTFLGYKAFIGCSAVDGFFFEGNAPALRRDVFAGCNRSTVYHRTDLRGWGKDLGGRPTGVWDPKQPFAYTNISGRITITRYANPGEAARVPDRIDGIPVTGIGPSAFQNCRHLTRVELPATLTRIGVGAFRDCVGLTGVAIPPGVTTVERSAFQNCSGLSEISLADGVRKIDTAAFAGCAKLTEVRLPASVASIGANVFADCPGLSAIRTEEGNPAFRSDKNGVLFSKDKTTLVCYPVGKAGKYTVPSCVTNIGPNAFESCTGLTCVALSRRLARIGNRAFARCPNLSSVKFPKGLADIGAGAFQDCVRLPSIELPERLSSLGDFAFWNCPLLTRVELPDNVVRLGGTTFGRCGGLEAIDVADANSAYCSSDGVVFSKDMTSLACYPSGKAGSYTIPGSVTHIGHSAFEGCGKVTEIVLPSSVTNLGNYAFKSCSGLTNIVLSANLTGLGVELFRDCLCLTDVTVPPQVASIGDRAFYHCPKLKELLFTGNAPRLGRDVFQNGTSPTVYYRSGTAGWGQRFGGLPTADAWRHPKAPIVECMNMSERQKFLDALRRATTKSAPPPSDSAGSPALTVGNTNVTYLKAKAVPPGIRVKLPSRILRNRVVSEASCEGYTYTVENGRATITGYNKEKVTGDFVITNRLGGCPVVSIGSLNNFRGLTSVTIPSGVAEIDPGAFFFCTSLTNVTIPASATRLGYRCFSLCDSLMSVNVEAANPAYSSRDGVLFNKDQTKLIKYPAGRSGHYTIPNSTTTIGLGAFSGAHLRSVAIPNSVTEIASEAFCHCSGLMDFSTGEGHSVFSSPDGVLFNKDQTVLIQFPRGRSGRFTIPSGVKSIGSVAFAFCHNLTDVTIPDSMTNLDTMAFCSCPRLTSVTVPDSVTRIGMDAFSNCDGLTTITIGKGVATIGERAFSRSRNLQGVYFKGNAPDLGVDVFKSSDKAIVFYLSGTEDWDTEFGGRPVKMWDPANPPQIDTKTPVAAPAPSPVTLKIGDPAPALAQGKYVQGEPVAAFERGKVYVVEFWATWCGPCRRVIPHINALQAKHKDRSLVVLGQNVWQRGENVEKDVIAFVQQMGTNMAYRVALDRDAAMAETWMKAAGKSGIPCAFVVGKDGKVAWIGHPMSGLDEKVEELLNGNPGGATHTPDQVAAEPCGNKSGAPENRFAHTVRNGKVIICKYTGSGGAVNIPGTIDGFPVTCIGDRTFEFNRSITSVSIPGGVTTIDDWAFYGCGNLTNAVIPNSVGAIGWAAFGGSGLTRVMLPASVTNIEGRAFENLDGASEIVVDAANPSYSSLGGVLFDKKQTTLIQWPNGKAANYTIPPGVTSIGRMAFFDCDTLTHVTFANSVASIGASAFSQCNRLASLTIPASVTNIENYAFVNCNRMTAFTVDPHNPSFSSVDGVLFNKRLDTLIHYPDSKAGPYTIPSSVTTVDSAAFQHCTGLTDVTIPANVAAIKDHAFFATGMTQVYVPASVTNIGNRAFGFSFKLTAIIVDPSNPFYSSRDGVLYDKEQTTLIECPAGFVGMLTVPQSVRFIDYAAFFHCPKLTSLYFLGDTPTPARVSGSRFFSSFKITGSGAITVYRRPDAKRWGDTFGGRPVKVWDVANPPPAEASPPAPARPAVTLKVGDPAPALAQGKYVQGQPVAAFEKGKVYVVEFWSTWCGPCRAVIPHVNNLQEKYKDKGLVVIGQNVWQRGENVEKDVTDFVKQMGADMGYRVALDRDGTMAETWMRAAGRGGIPCAFVVDKDGKVAWIGHPMSGLDEVAERLLAGTFDIEKEKTKQMSFTRSIPAEHTFACSTNNGTLTLTKYTGPGGEVAVPCAINGLSVTVIGDRAFDRCSSLTRVEVPASVKSIGDYAFRACVNLKGVTLPESGTFVSTNAFEGCRPGVIDDLYATLQRRGYSRDMHMRPREDPFAKLRKKK